MPKLLKHPSGITFEIAEKPWFGPKQRGRAMLLASPRYGRETRCEEFIEFLLTEFPAFFKHIQHIRFHRCEFAEEGKPSWALRYAILYTYPDYETRQVLYKQGETVTNLTGWYPLVTGQRVRLYRSSDPQWLSEGRGLSEHLMDHEFGGLRSIANINTKDAGCSLILEFEHRAVLLDFGFSFSAPEIQNRPTFGVLTHTHRDHSGGTRDALKDGIPALMSESVFLQLSACQRWLGSEMSRIGQVRPPCSIRSGRDGTRFDFLPGAHSPGAMMVLVTGADGTQVLYPGDYCLSNRYYSQEPSHLCNLLSGSTGAKFLLIDGTFLGHGPRPSEASDGLVATLSAAHNEGLPIVFSAESLDYLFAAYIWYFKSFYGGPKQKITRHLIVQELLIRLIETSFEAFIHRRHEEFDSFLKATVGTSMSNYLESVRLYPFSVGSWPGHVDGPTDLFCSADLVDEACKKLSRQPLVVLIGRSRRETAESLPVKSTCTLDGPDFAFHSTPKDVAAIVRCAVRKGIRPLVFHNFGKRIRKALKDEGISEQDYEVVGDRPVSLKLR